MEAVHPLDLLASLLRSAELVANGDSFDHEHVVLQENLAHGFNFEALPLDVDLTRLQRACERAGQSAAGGGHDIVERRRVRMELFGIGPIMLGHLGVHPKRHRLGLRGQVRQALRTAEALNPHPGKVGGISHVRVLPEMTGP
jgi:hypothetical protein